MMACLLAEIRTNQAKADGNLQEMMEEITAHQELLKQEMLAKLNVYPKRMMARMDSQLENMKAVEYIQDKTFNKIDTTVLEASRERAQTVVELQDTLNVEGVVEIVVALEE